MITSLLSRAGVRSGLLALLFLNPDRRYYQRQLERLLRRPVSAVRREILRLEGEGLLRRSSEANLVYFQANRDHPLFAEVSSIVAKTVGIPAALRSALQGVKGVALAFLFGSYPRFLAREPDAAWTAESDLDLLVVGRVDLGKVSGALRPLENRFQRTVNPTLYSASELADRLDREDPFIADVLGHLIIPLIGLGASEILGPRRLGSGDLREAIRGPEGNRRPGGQQRTPKGRPQRRPRRRSH